MKKKEVNKRQTTETINATPETIELRTRKNNEKDLNSFVTAVPKPLGYSVVSLPTKYLSVADRAALFYIIRLF